MNYVLPLPNCGRNKHIGLLVMHMSVNVRCNNELWDVLQILFSFLCISTPTPTLPCRVISFHCAMIAFVL